MKRLILKPLAKTAPQTKAGVDILVEHLLKTFADRLPQPPKAAR